MAILRMTRGSRHGACSRKFHEVPRGSNPGRAAICGARPSVGEVKDGIVRSGVLGWGELRGSAVTCPKCQEVLRGERKRRAA